jgi:glutathione S-transferase
MIRLYHSPRTRSVRVRWLLEELGLPYALEWIDFVPPATGFFGQKTPTGKLPTLVDGDVVMCESGAIVEYLLERYGEGRLEPPPGSPERARFLQWLHFAESTAFPPVGIIVWLTRYRGEQVPASLLEDARTRARDGFDFLEAELGDRPYVCGDDFSAADVMLGFTLAAARLLGVLGDRHPALGAYLSRLEARPAFQKAIGPEPS